VPTRVSLALGAGGARGYAHIGVLRALEERDLEVVALAGTSMGALVGGLAAAGHVAEFAAWAATLRQRDVLRLLDPKLSAPGMLSADRLLDRIHEIFPDVLIEELPIPFTAVATDLAARREVWFQRGPLRAAVRASIAIPGVFTPAMLNGRVLVDGGLSNPVPLDPTAAVPSDLTIAVSLTGRRRVRDPVAPAATSSAPERFEEWRGRLRRTLSGLTGQEVHEPESPPEPARTAWGTEVLPSELRLLDVTAQSFEAMQGALTRYRMAAVPADVVVTVPVDACRSTDFHRAEELIDLGRRLAVEALDAAGV
jgi:NTE family protein